MLQDILCGRGVHRWHEHIISHGGKDLLVTRCLHCGKTKKMVMTRIFYLPSGEPRPQSVQLRFNQSQSKDKTT